MVTDTKTYEVTGELTPDSTGTYQDAGEYNGKRYYVRVPAGFSIWWDGVDSWIISTVLGDLGTGHWRQTDLNIVGTYDAVPDAAGEATVTEI